MHIAGKKSKTYYVGQVHTAQGDLIKTKFLRRSDLHKGTKMSFSYPMSDGGENSRDELASHERSAVVMKLTEPSNAGGTKRCASKHVFPSDLSAYDSL